jgi:hypothetical protein
VADAVDAIVVRKPPPPDVILRCVTTAVIRSCRAALGGLALAAIAYEKSRASVSHWSTTDYFSYSPSPAICSRPRSLLAGALR